MSSQAALKTSLRSSVRSALNAQDREYIVARSRIISERQFQQEWFLRARGVCVFASQKHEVDTLPILEAVLASGKACYLPRVTGDVDMEMYRVYSIEDYLSLPKGRWGVIEPESTLRSFNGTDNLRENPLLSIDTNIDLIILPGLAFDATLNRVGYGKGYYDRYVKRILQQHHKPVLTGICLDEQVCEQVPVEEHDVPLEYLITPSKLYSKEDKIKE